MKYNNPVLKNFSDIYNPYTLNIFSDASMRISKGGITSGCYGVVAVCMDNIIYSFYRIHSNTTVNAEEARGIRSALAIALQYRYQFKNINIFSDSAISIIGLREYTQKWVYNENDNTLYKNKSFGSEVANQGLFVEMYNFATELRKTNQLGLYHIKGHVSFEGHQKTINSNIHTAYKVFLRENNCNGSLDINIIRYLCTYNTFVDNGSRSVLLRTNVYDNIGYKDVVSFYPTQNLYW